MVDFDSSPRSSKRRKVTYGSTRSTVVSLDAKSPSVLHSLSSPVSGSSRRLFEPAVSTDALTSSTTDSLHGTKEGGPSDGAAFLERDNTEEHDQSQYTSTTGNTVVEEGNIEGASASRFGSPNTPVKTSKNVTGRVIRSTGESGIQKRSSGRTQGRSNDQTKVFARNGDGSTSADLRNMKNAGAKGRSTKTDSELPTETLTASSEKNLKDSRGKESPTGDMNEEDPITMPAGEEEEDRENAQPDDTIVVSQRSSGRERRKPRRYSNDVEKLAERERETPKGILTPSRGDRKRIRKSVAFEDENERHGSRLEFKNIDLSTEASSKKKKRMTKPRQSHSTDPEVSLVDDLVGDEAVNRESTPEVPDILNLECQTAPLFDPAPVVDEDPHLTSIKAKIISRLTGSTLVPLTNLITEYTKVHTLVKATITAGEGNSILVLGARGSSKTNLVETALADVRHDHAGEFHVVRLNGFQQTDDKIALREIWRQLGREMQVEEDETSQVSSYADTMASLLHLLSHPEELAEVLDPDAPALTTKSVVFVLDEFDLFTTHPRQTLLYNLFDIAQAKKAPIAVIGCSTRVDVTESLEKRVKSRFSHRWIHLAQAKSFSVFEEVVRTALCLTVGEERVLDVIASDWRDRWNDYIKSTFITSSTIQSLLRQTFYTTKSIPSIFSALYIPITSITSLSDLPNLSATIAPLTPPDSPLTLLPCLPHLHLCLLIAAARLDAIHNAAIVNFNLVYHHYVELASRARLQASASGALAQGGMTKIWGVEAAGAAWEELSEWEILVPAGLGKGKGGDDAPEIRMWKVDVTLEEVGACLVDGGGRMSDVLTKWCKEV